MNDVKLTHNIHVLLPDVCKLLMFVFVRRGRLETGLRSGCKAWVCNQRDLHDGICTAQHAPRRLWKPARSV